MPGLRRSRAAGALAALAAAVLTFALSAGPAWAVGSARAGGPTIGPVQINPVGHPRLCWQAGGNGSGVTLERCDPVLQGQQWSLTSDGVRPVPPILRRPCPAGSRWSIGYSAVTVAPGPGGGQRGPDGGTFTASVTVADAASAQAAYGVAVTFSLPPHLSPSGLHVTGAAGWTCDVRRVTCTGTLPSGASGQVAVIGRLPAAAQPGGSYTVRARAAVTGTSERPGTPRTATTPLTVPVHSAPARSAAHSPLLLIAAVAGALLLAGSLLVYITRRRPRHAARPRSRSPT